MPTVKLLYAKDCPNVAQARANLARALTEVGLPPSWKELELSSPETTARLRRFGSPSVFVDGCDVASVEPGDAAACRVYEIEGGRRSGVPPIDLIARALTNAAREHRPARGTLGRTLFVLPGAALALVPSLTCPACWPTYAALLSTLGVGFIPTAPYLFPLTALCLIVAVAAVTMTARQRGRVAPIIVALFAAVMIPLAKFGFHVTSATYGGAALLVGASIWARRPVPGPCPGCVPAGRDGAAPVIPRKEGGEDDGEERFPVPGL